jgi:rhodanese-related sulfurtransferase
MLQDGEELAILDIREELHFSQSHLLHARSAPLSRLELRAAQLVPRRDTRIALVDGDGALTAAAAEVLIQQGYSNLFLLEGGNGEWVDAGYLLYSGVHVPSKAFGEVVEHACDTPSIDAATLKNLLDSGDDVLVVDSRPFDEFSRISIPGAVNVPGAELVLRVLELVRSPRTTVVVNCAGRTRSIIGAQSLINAGLPNQVVSLRNGTMGWTLAGYQPDRGRMDRLPSTSATRAAWAQAAAQKVGRATGVRHIDLPALQKLREDVSRTLYVFDVRDPREYEAGHLAGATHAPGGQLVQATDYYIGTLNARVVLVDDLEVRAVMTASWLMQMGWPDVFVLVASGNETGWPPIPLASLPDHAELRIGAAEAAKLRQRDAATFVDLSLSRDYSRGHIPGAWFAIRRRLAQAVSKIGLHDIVVLTSEDGTLAQLAMREMQSLTDLPVRYLEGGNRALVEAGGELTRENPRFADDPIDVWLKPYERPAQQEAAMNEYLSWEIELAERVAQDPSCRFRPLVP